MNLDRTVTNLPAIALSLCIGSSRNSLPIIVANQGIYGSPHKNYKTPCGDYYFEAGHSGTTQTIHSLKLTARKKPENRLKPKRKIIFQPSIFRGYVSFRDGIFLRDTTSFNQHHPVPKINSNDPFPGRRTFDLSLPVKALPKKKGMPKPQKKHGRVVFWVETCLCWCSWICGLRYLEKNPQIFSPIVV